MQVGTLTSNGYCKLDIAAPTIIVSTEAFVEFIETMGFNAKNAATQKSHFFGMNCKNFVFLNLLYSFVLL